MRFLPTKKAGTANAEKPSVTLSQLERQLRILWRVLILLSILSVGMYMALVRLYLLGIKDADNLLHLQRFVMELERKLSSKETL